MMTSETQRIDRIVQQFLEYARPPRLAPEAVDLGALVRRRRGERARSRAESRGVRLEVDAPGAGTAVVDPAQLRQALDNLVRNAIDATPEGGRVSLAARREGEGHAIEVRDTGRGIEPDHLPRIFDLYFTTKADGTGVGLAVTQQIVTAHGGTIEVDSRPGGGHDHDRAPARGRGEGAWLSGSSWWWTTRSRSAACSPASCARPATRWRRSGTRTRRSRSSPSRTVDLVLTDLRMPGKTGVELLDAVRGVNPEIPVVVMTAYGTVASAVDAMKRGAADYLGKPVDLDELEVLVTRTLERRALVSENRALREQVESRYRLAGLETGNARMQEAINMAARAAASRATILIHGESGTGKELLARAIHYASPRRRGPLVAVNVAALPETLLESELFGHERGAFTGADREHRGRFELADGGTLFLDEIGDLPRGTQVKLLRVLQEQSFERLGGTQPIKVDVRIIAATHRDLEAMARAGDFREDLFFRLNVVAITLPPLRERREDIPLLVDHFLRRFADEGKARSVSREAMDLLLKHDYPGNVRELENLVHRAVVLARGDVITTGGPAAPPRRPEARGEGRRRRASPSGWRPSRGLSSTRRSRRPAACRRARRPRSA